MAPRIARLIATTLLLAAPGLASAAIAPAEADYTRLLKGLRVDANALNRADENRLGEVTPRAPWSLVPAHDLRQRLPYVSEAYELTALEFDAALLSEWSELDTAGRLAALRKLAADFSAGAAPDSEFVAFHLDRGWWPGAGRASEAYEKQRALVRSLGAPGPVFKNSLPDLASSAHAPLFLALTVYGDQRAPLLVALARRREFPRADSAQPGYVLSPKPVPSAVPRRDLLDRATAVELLRELPVPPAGADASPAAWPLFVAAGSAALEALQVMLDPASAERERIASAQAGRWPVADLAARDLAGRKTLHWAAWRGDKATLLWLLAHGADPDARDAQGRNLLHYAVLNPDPDVLFAALLHLDRSQRETLLRQTSRDGFHPLRLAELRVRSADINPHPDDPLPASDTRSLGGTPRVLTPATRSPWLVHYALLQDQVLLDNLAGALRDSGSEVSAWRDLGRNREVEGRLVGAAPGGASLFIEAEGGVTEIIPDSPGREQAARALAERGANTSRPAGAGGQFFLSPDEAPGNSSDKDGAPLVWRSTKPGAAPVVGTLRNVGGGLLEIIQPDGRTARLAVADLHPDDAKRVSAALDRAPNLPRSPFSWRIRSTQNGNRNLTARLVRIEREPVSLDDASRPTFSASSPGAPSPVVEREVAVLMPWDSAKGDSPTGPIRVPLSDLDLDSAFKARQLQTLNDQVEALSKGGNRAPGPTASPARARRLVLGVNDDSVLLAPPDPSSRNPGLRPLSTLSLKQSAELAEIRQPWLDQTYSELQRGSMLGRPLRDPNAPDRPFGLACDAPPEQIARLGDADFLERISLPRPASSFGPPQTPGRPTFPTGPASPAGPSFPRSPAPVSGGTAFGTPPVNYPEQEGNNPLLWRLAPDTALAPAAFVGLDDENLVLQRPDGARVTLPRGQLSSAALRMASQLRAIPALHASADVFHLPLTAEELAAPPPPRVVVDQMFDHGTRSAVLVLREYALDQAPRIRRVPVSGLPAATRERLSRLEEGARQYHQTKTHDPAAAP